MGNLRCGEESIIPKNLIGSDGIWSKDESYEQGKYCWKDEALDESPSKGWIESWCFGGNYEKSK